MFRNKYYWTRNFSQSFKVILTELRLILFSYGRIQNFFDFCKALLCIFCVCITFC